jgi:hypothetical protein
MIPRGVEYIVVRTDIATEVVAVDAVAQVVPDLLLSGEAAAPGGFSSKENEYSWEGTSQAQPG